MKTNRKTGEMSGLKDEIRKFEAFKARFDILIAELHDLQEEWQDIHQGSPNRLHGHQHDAIIARKNEIFSEIEQLIQSAPQVVREQMEQDR